MDLRAESIFGVNGEKFSGVDSRIMNCFQLSKRQERHDTATQDKLIAAWPNGRQNRKGRYGHPDRFPGAVARLHSRELSGLQTYLSGIRCVGTDSRQLVGWQGRVQRCICRHSADNSSQARLSDADCRRVAGRRQTLARYSQTSQMGSARSVVRPITGGRGCLRDVPPLPCSGPAAGRCAYRSAAPVGVRA